MKTTYQFYTVDSLQGSTGSLGHILYILLLKHKALFIYYEKIYET